MLRKEQLGKHGSQMSDDEPLYDSVASDDDYAALATENPAGLSATIASENEVRREQFNSPSHLHTNSVDGRCE